MIDGLTEHDRCHDSGVAMCDARSPGSQVKRREPIETWQRPLTGFRYPAPGFSFLFRFAQPCLAGPLPPVVRNGMIGIGGISTLDPTAGRRNSSTPAGPQASQRNAGLSSGARK